MGQAFEQIDSHRHTKTHSISKRIAIAGDVHGSIDQARRSVRPVPSMCVEAETSYVPTPRRAIEKGRRSSSGWIGFVLRGILPCSRTLYDRAPFDTDRQLPGNPPGHALFDASGMACANRSNGTRGVSFAVRLL